MIKYEYTVLVARKDAQKDEMREMNNLGDAGWEVFQVEEVEGGYMRIYGRRPVSA